MPHASAHPESRGLSLAGGCVALAYIAVQAFQAYVFGRFPESGSPAEALMQGAERLQVARSFLMLLSMFGLVVMFWAICARRLRANPAWAALAFLGFLGFCSLEIGLRSVELFWTQVQLPAEYAKAADAAARAVILHQVEVFQSIQHALYFPLGLSQLLGSAVVVFLFRKGRNLDLLLSGAMGLNVLRLLLRTVSVYGGIPLISGAAYDRFYFPLVIAVNLPIALWFFMGQEERP